jgi:hypothetical protein
MDSQEVSEVTTSVTVDGRILWHKNGTNDTYYEQDRQGSLIGTLSEAGKSNFEGSSTDLMKGLKGFQCLSCQENMKSGRKNKSIPTGNSSLNPG